MGTQYTKNFALALPDFRSGPWHDLVNGDFTKLDQIVYGALSQVDTPLWTNNTHYGIGLTALDGDNGTTWMNTVDHTSPATGTFADARDANPTYWTQLLAGFAPRGEWANDTNYFPYDLVYQTNLGILALCTTRHLSNSSGTIQDDEALWSFLVDFSSLGTAAAIAVAYTPTAPLTKTNVQQVIEEVEGQVIALNNVNVTQGNQITTLQNTDTTHETRMTSIESKNTTQDSQISVLQTSVTNNTNSINSLTSNKANDSAVVHKTGDVMSGLLNSAVSGTLLAGGAVNSVVVNGASNDWAAMSFLSAGVFGANFGLHPNGNFYMGGWSHGGNSYKFWTARDCGTIVQNARLAFAADYTHNYTTGLAEPYAGAVITGASGNTLSSSNQTFRYRYMQIQFNGGSWGTIGYV